MRIGELLSVQNLNETKMANGLCLLGGMMGVLGFIIVLGLLCMCLKFSMI